MMSPYFDPTTARPRSRLESVQGSGVAATWRSWWPAAVAVLLLFWAAFGHITAGQSALADRGAEGAAVVPITATEPEYTDLRPEQRCGVVVFSMKGVDIERLHTGFIKLNNRGPSAWERRRGFDFCTVLLEDTRTYELPDPQTYWASIEQMVSENPGHLWFVGNEPENPCRFGSHSSEYAQRYHKMYYFIKQRDPAAQVGIGGVVVPSRARRDWLEKVMDYYKAMYGETMPVDVWNIHNLLLSECPGECGCPEGNTCGTLCCGGGYMPSEFWCDASRRTYRTQADQARADLFEELIWEFRRWMATREEARDKPLIITEMGVFAWNTEQSGGPFPRERINQFMYETFDFMMNTTDPEIGYSGDGYRLVQRWTWFKLESRSETGREANGFLFDLDGNITDFGLNFANYTARFLPTSPVSIFFQTGWTGYTGDTDTTVTPAESRPAGIRLWISPDGSQKALLQFDLSILPANVEVVSATLNLVSSFHSGVGDVRVNCYAIKRPWNIGQATWTNATEATRWEEPGCSGPGDREMTPASSVVVTAEGATYSWDVTDLASGWLADPSTNHGILLEAAEGSAGGSGYWTFVSANQAEDTRPGAEWTYRGRPKLELVVRLPEPTPTPSATATEGVTETPTATPSATMTPTPTVSTYTVYLPIILKEE